MEETSESKIEPKTKAVDLVTVKEFVPMASKMKMNETNSVNQETSSVGNLPTNAPLSTLLSKNNFKEFVPSNNETNLPSMLGKGKFKEFVPGNIDSNAEHGDLSNAELSAVVDGYADAEEFFEENTDYQGDVADEFNELSYDDIYEPEFSNDMIGSTWNANSREIPFASVGSSLHGGDSRIANEDLTSALWNSQQQSIHGVSTNTISTHVEFPLKSLKRPFEYEFANENLRMEIVEQYRVLNERIFPEDARFQELPETLNQEMYHTIFPLELNKSLVTDKNSFSSLVYKVTSRVDGYCYCLRRMIKCRLTIEEISSSLQPWLNLAVHPNIVGIRDCFASGQHDFSDQLNSLCFVFDFFPCATNISHKYFSNSGPILSESLLWSYFVQMLLGLSAIHTSGLAYRQFSPSNILICANNRIKLNNAGLLDAMQGIPPNKTLAEAQSEDIQALAQLVLQLGCMNLQASQKQKLNASLDFVGTISADLKKVLFFILGRHDKNRLLTVFDISAMIHHRLLIEMQNSFQQNSSMESELFKEIHNGRLIRLLVKLNQIVNRPELNGDRHWSDNPDRYLLKLFYNFVFYQVHEEGIPNVDIGHVVQALDKLDHGSQEKIMLLGSNEKHVMIVSFQDVLHCLNTSYQQLCSFQPKVPEKEFRFTPAIRSKQTHLAVKAPTHSNVLAPSVGFKGKAAETGIINRTWASKDETASFTNVSQPVKPSNPESSFVSRDLQLQQQAHFIQEQQKKQAQQMQAHQIAQQMQAQQIQAQQVNVNHMMQHPPMFAHQIQVPQQINLQAQSYHSNQSTPRNMVQGSFQSFQPNINPVFIPNQPAPYQMQSNMYQNQSLPPPLVNQPVSNSSAAVYYQNPRQFPSQNYGNGPYQR